MAGTKRRNPSAVDALPGDARKASRNRFKQEVEKARARLDQQLANSLELIGLTREQAEQGGRHVAQLMLAKADGLGANGPAHDSATRAVEDLIDAAQPFAPADTITTLAATAAFLKLTDSRQEDPEAAISALIHIAFSLGMARAGLTGSALKASAEAAQWARADAKQDADTEAAFLEMARESEAMEQKRRAEETGRQGAALRHARTKQLKDWALEHYAQERGSDRTIADRLALRIPDHLRDASNDPGRLIYDAIRASRTPRKL